MAEITRRQGLDFNPVHAEWWLREEVFKNSQYLPIRTQNAFLIAYINPTPWQMAELECHVLVLVSDEDCIWEAVRLLRYSIEYAKACGCSFWRYSWDYGDAGTLVRRVGAREDVPRYIINLGRK